MDNYEYDNDYGLLNEQTDTGYIPTVDLTSNTENDDPLGWGDDDPLGPITGDNTETPPAFDADAFWKSLYGELGGTPGFGSGPVKFGNFFDPYSVGYGFDPSTAGGSYDAWMGNPDVLKYAKDALNKPEFSGKTLANVVKGLYDKFGEFANSSLGKGILGTLGGLAAVKFDKLPPSGGGYTKAYRGYTPTDTRTVVNTRHGPVVQYFKKPGGIGDLPPGGGNNTVVGGGGNDTVVGGGGGGGSKPPSLSPEQQKANYDKMMNTPVDLIGIPPRLEQKDNPNNFAQGGPVRLEDGGFVMTKRAVDGAGGPQGIRSLVPGAQMIRGPGTGTSDSIPAVIQGKNGTTPAAVSNGEAYLNKQATQQNGGASQLYALMNNLQRRG